MPSSTSAAAASAAARFSSSASGAVNAGGTLRTHRHLNDGLSRQRRLDQLCINTIRTLSIDADPGGELGPPGHADGDGAGRLRALAALPALRPRGPDLAEPRPLRAVGRPRLDAALLAAAPRAREGGGPRLRDARRAVGEARRHRALPPARLEGGRATPSTAGPPASRRRPARSARASRPPSGWRSPGSGSPPTSTGPGFELFDFDVYVLAGDGDLMEGVSYEAASIAGHLRLSNLCWIYDNNHITIDGSTALTFSDDVATRFIGQGWNVTRVGDANDLEMLDARLRDLQARGRAADADRRRQPHRLRRARRPGHGQGPRRAARRGGGARSRSAATAGPRTRSS